MPEPCDCLIYCGDDPWLQDGRARPCDRKRAADREIVERLERHQRTEQLLRELGHLSVLSALQELAAYRKQSKRS